MFVWDDHERGGEWERGTSTSSPSSFDALLSIIRAPKKRYSERRASGSERVCDLHYLTSPSVTVCRLSSTTTRGTACVVNKSWRGVMCLSSIESELWRESERERGKQQQTCASLSQSLTQSAASAIAIVVTSTFPRNSQKINLFPVEVRSLNRTRSFVRSKRISISRSSSTQLWWKVSSTCSSSISSSPAHYYLLLLPSSSAPPLQFKYSTQRSTSERK